MLRSNVAVTRHLKRLALLRCARPQVLKRKLLCAGTLAHDSGFIEGARLLHLSRSLQDDEKKDDRSETRRLYRLSSAEGLSQFDFNYVADNVLNFISDRLETILEEAGDDFDINFSQGVLNVALGSHGTWVINKQGPNKQIWWSSPISGPKRFEYDPDSETWHNTRDGQALFELLQTELKQTIGVDVDFENDAHFE